MLSDRQLEEAIEKAYSLQGGGVLRQYTFGELRSICNGIGARWMDSISICGTSASDILNMLNGWAIPASVIHDVRYYEGGDEGCRIAADTEFLSNLLQSIGCKWWNPKFWWRRHKAFRMFDALRAFGNIAFSYNEEYASYTATM